MKRYYFLSLLLTVSLVTFAQSLVIENSMMKIDNSSVMSQYANYFGEFNNPDVDEPFPYAAIRMDLIGDAKDVNSAKENFRLTMGTLHQVQSTNRSEPNRIIFLVPRSVKHIDLECVGVPTQTLWTGALQANTVYVCKVRYKAPEADSSNKELAAMMAQMNATLQQMQNGQSAAPAQQQATGQSATVSQPAKAVKSKPVKKTLPEGVGLVMNSKADMKYLGKKHYTLNGNTDMDDKEIATFYRENSPEAYKKYMQGKKCKVAGWVSFGIGLAAVAGGSALLVMDGKNEVAANEKASQIDPNDKSDWRNWSKEDPSISGLYYTYADGKLYYYDPNAGMYFRWDSLRGATDYSTVNPLADTNSNTAATTDNQQWMAPVGYTLLAVGATLTVVSVPLLCTGYAKMKNAYKAYNKKLLDSYAFTGFEQGNYTPYKKEPVQLKLNLAPQTVGLALRF